MGLRIRTNVQSLVSQRHLSASSKAVAAQTEKLSSGYRINKGADDAAGFAIAEALKGDIRSLAQARRNANDAVSLVEVAEGGLDEINNIMIRLRELTVQAASDTIGTRERTYLNEEFMALKDEIDRIAISTEFNGTRLLTGQKELDPVLLAEHNYSPLEIQVGKDYFPGPDALSAPNPVDIIRLNLGNLNASTDGENSLGLGSAQNSEGTRIDNKVSAQSAIVVIDNAMDKVASYRGSLGAIQNRFQSTDRNLGIQIEALSAARSRIKDADFAAESAELSQQNILQQAGAAVLAQANQLPNIALKLLQ
ncbi:flagellin FliC [bacterium]|nr:flagellin FliC [bacterium]